MQVVCLSIYSVMEEYVMNTVDNTTINIKKVRILLKRKEAIELFEREFLRRYSLCDVYVNELGEISINKPLKGQEKPQIEPEKPAATQGRGRVLRGHTSYKW